MPWEITPTYQLWGVATGIFFACALYPTARRAGIDFWDYWKMGIVACISLYLGARLFWELVEFPLMPGRMWVSPDPLLARIARPLGFTYLGGLAGLAVGETLLGCTPAVKHGPGKLLDVLAPICALSFAVSKVGCMLAGCCYGAATEGWLGITVSTMHSQGPVRVLPVRWLEMAAGLLVGASALWMVLGRQAGIKKLRDGTVFAATFTVSALLRFGFGFMRGEYEIALGALSAVQVGALVMAGIGGLVTAALVATSHMTEGEDDDARDHGEHHRS